MTDYIEFDAKLIERITTRPATFTQLSTYMNADAEFIAQLNGKPQSEAFRVTDRRLQALRKRGLISYSGKTGWHIV